MVNDVSKYFFSSEDDFTNIDTFIISEVKGKKKLFPEHVAYSLELDLLLNNNPIYSCDVEVKIGGYSNDNLRYHLSNVDLYLSHTHTHTHTHTHMHTRTHARMHTRLRMQQ